MNNMQNENNINMNDENYLNDILESEKNMGVNFTYALNEASCEYLFSKIYDMFKQIKKAQRDLFFLAYKKGFYPLEEADKSKIDEEYNKLSNKFNEIKN